MKSLDSLLIQLLWTERITVDEKGQIRFYLPKPSRTAELLNELPDWTRSQ